MIRRAGPAALLVAAALAAGAGCRGRQPNEAPRDDEPQAVPVAASAATTGTLRTSVHAAGVVRPSEGAEFLVVAPETARLLDTPREPGTMVASGDVLARFDLPVATQEATRLRAELARLQADLERARQAQNRTNDFVDRGLVPRRDRDEAQQAVLDAQGAVDRTAASLAAAERALTRGIVRAPFTGLIAGRFHVAGDLVQGAATDPVLRLVDPTRLEVVATIDEADLARVVVGASARTPNPADGQPLPLTVAGLPQRRPGDGPAVRLTLPGPTMLAVDMALDVEIDAEARDGVVFVPQEAILRADGETAVMIAAGDHAERRRVVVGVSSGRQVEVVSGVAAGDLVITRGHVGLPDAAPVSVAIETR